jgi:hypothetical protein
LDMCGVGVEATWTACEAVATAWACQQGGVVLLHQDRLDRRVTCGLCRGCECVYPHVCCRVDCVFRSRRRLCASHTVVVSWLLRFRTAALIASGVVGQLTAVCHVACVDAREGLVCRSYPVRLLLSACVVVTAAVTATKRRAAVSWRLHRSSSRLQTCVAMLPWCPLR